MRVAALRATVVIRAGSIPTTRSAMTASTAAHAACVEAVAGGDHLAGVDGGQLAGDDLARAGRGKRPARFAARPTLRPAAHCPTPVARDTSVEVIASMNPSSWWTCDRAAFGQPGLVRPGVRDRDQLAPSTAFATP